MRRTILRSLFLLIVLGETSCAGPKIGPFQADPLRVCPGHATTVSWNVKGDAVLSSTPILPGTGPVKGKGKQAFTPNQTTHFQISVGPDVENAPHPLLVEVLRPGALDSLYFRVGDIVDQGLVATDTLAVSEWDQSARITWIFNDQNRTIRAEHGGRSLSMAAGDSTDAFRGLPITGTWNLRSPLEPGEEPGDPQHSPPSFLKVLFKFTCES